jgi:hypothetical protein
MGAQVILRAEAKGLPMQTVHAGKDFLHAEQIEAESRTDNASVADTSHHFGEAGKESYLPNALFEVEVAALRGGAGLVHVLGPTGGYLLAFPAAAAVAGAVVAPAADGRVSLLRALAGCTAGLALIHAGGLAQLAALGLDPAAAFRVGFIPFFTGDLLKVGLAAGLIAVFGPRLRGLR